MKTYNQVVYNWIADIDECSEGTDSCNTARSSCLNTVGSYNCSCASGYEDSGDGKTCNGKKDTINRPSHLEFGGALLFTLWICLGTQLGAQLELLASKITGTGTNKEPNK